MKRKYSNAPEPITGAPTTRRQDGNQRLEEMDRFLMFKEEVYRNGQEVNGGEALTCMAARTRPITVDSRLVCIG